MENANRLNLTSSYVWRTLARYRLVVAMLLLGVLGVAVHHHFKHPTLKNFAHASATDIADLKASWHSGQIIVFVRHAERCDQSDSLCLSAKEGITARGSDAARAVGEEYQRLGLDNTDVFTSPLPRTTQTAAFMFKHATQTQEWLADCRTTLLANAIKHKAVGRNLILVTHSDCIREVEKGLKVYLPNKPTYTSSLFISFGETSTHPHALGFIDAAPFAADFKPVQ